MVIDLHFSDSLIPDLSVSPERQEAYIVKRALGQPVSKVQSLTTPSPLSIIWRDLEYYRFLVLPLKTARSELLRGGHRNLHLKNLKKN